MQKLKELFSLNTKTVMDLTPNQAIELAAVAFHGKGIKWEITRSDKSGYWLNGIDHLKIKYYFRINEYFEIYESTTFEKSATDKEETKTYEGHLGKIDLSWKYGVPYINVVAWFYENGFNIFGRYPKN